VSEHLHATHVPGCPRCEESRLEAEEAPARDALAEYWNAPSGESRQEVRRLHRIAHLAERVVNATRGRWSEEWSTLPDMLATLGDMGPAVAALCASVRQPPTGRRGDCVRCGEGHGRHALGCIHAPAPRKPS
jgi:hypothetical protein